MPTRVSGPSVCLTFVLLLLCGTQAPTGASWDGTPVPPLHKEADVPEKIMKSNEEWRKILTKEQYEITRKKGTERPFSGRYHDFKGKGIYRCVCCDLTLFSSQTKYDSGTGWPSFWEPVLEHHVKTAPDNSLFMKRTEVLCNRCDAHLGHVFNDGPPHTGLRYCINSAALRFDDGKGATLTAQ